MSQKNETAVLLLALIVTAALLGGGFWWFTRSSGINSGGANKGDNNNQNQPQTSQSPNSPAQPAPAPSTPSVPTSTFALPASVPSGTSVRIEGATSMVQINQALKNGFQTQFPGTAVNTAAGGTEKGIQALQSGTADVAAISRPLTSQEQSQG